MRHPHELSKLLTRRAFVLGGVQISLATVLASRLYYLQFAQGENYRVQAEDNRVSLQLLAPPRGLLLDFRGTALASNQIDYHVLLEKGEAKQTGVTLGRAAELLEMDDLDRARLIRDLSHVNRGHAIVVKDYLSWNELVALKFHSPRLPGLTIEKGFMRHYPFAESAAHLIGFVGGVTQGELDAEDDEGVLHLPGFKIGKDGLEQMLETRLRGKAGMLRMEVNAHGLPVKELGREPSVAGEDVRLTIDARLQQYAAERLGDQSGSAIVMRVDNGDVLALASMPAFDSNRFSKGIEKNYWAALLADKMHPLINKAVAGQYPPGSTFKMLVGLAALESGVATAASRVVCPGHFWLGNHSFSCWKPQGHGSVNIVEALAKSCDVFFYTMASRLGIDRITDMGRRFGMGAPTGIGLANEKGGTMPSDAWKRAHHWGGWQAGDTINCGIGQGYVLSTPMQLAVMTARIASGGLAIVPRLVKPAKEKPIPRVAIDPALIAVVQQGMDAVCNQSYGTAYAHAIRTGLYRMSGKTGTSQVRRITVHGQDQSKIPYEQRHHALFVGYAPSDAPKYAVAVMIEHGGGGASAAAPVARDLLARTLELYDAPVEKTAEKEGAANG